MHIGILRLNRQHELFSSTNWQSCTSPRPTNFLPQNNCSCPKTPRWLLHPNSCIQGASELRGQLQNQPGGANWKNIQFFKPNFLSVSLCQVSKQGCHKGHEDFFNAVYWFIALNVHNLKENHSLMKDILLIWNLNKPAWQPWF